jgi:methyl-accepting chemotaxis protein
MLSNMTIKPRLILGECVSVVLIGADESVTRSDPGVSDITAAVSEQSIASTGIARKVEKIAQMSEENHAAVGRFKA